MPSSNVVLRRIGPTSFIFDLSLRIVDESSGDVAESRSVDCNVSKILIFLILIWLGVGSPICDSGALDDVLIYESLLMLVPANFAASIIARNRSGRDSTSETYLPRKSCSELCDLKVKPKRLNVPDAAIAMAQPKQQCSLHHHHCRRWRKCNHLKPKIVRFIFAAVNTLRRR